MEFVNKKIAVILVALFIISLIYLLTDRNLEMNTQDWPMYQGNEKHYIDFNLPKNPTSIDLVNVPKPFIYSVWPLINTNEIFTGLSDTSGIYIEDTTTIKKLDKLQKLIWTYNCDKGWTFPALTQSNIALGKRNVVFVQYHPEKQQGEIVSINKDTGKREWTLKLPSWPQISELPSPNSVVITIEDNVGYVGINAYQGKQNFLAVDLSNGKILWKQKLLGSFLGNSSPVIYNNKIVTLIKTKDDLSKIYIFDKEDGLSINEISIKGQFSNAPVIQGSSLFLVSDPIVGPSESYSNIYKYNLNSNSIEWEFKVKPSEAFAIKGHDLIIGRVDDVFLFDTKNKIIKWYLKDTVTDYSSGTFSNLIITNNTIVSGRDDGYIYLINLKNGEVLKKTKVKTLWQKILGYSPAIEYMIPAHDGIIAFLGSGDLVYIH